MKWIIYSKFIYIFYMYKWILDNCKRFETEALQLSKRSIDCFLWNKSTKDRSLFVLYIKKMKKDWISRFYSLIRTLKNSLKVYLWIQD